MSENAESPPKKISLKRITFMLGIGVIPLAISICFIQVPPPSCACSNRGIDMVKAYIKSQQAYFTEHQTFTSSYKSLGVAEIPSKITLYIISTEVSKDKVLVYGTPRELPSDLFRLGLTKAEIKSFVDVVSYDKKLQEPVSILCISEKSTLDKPPTPIFDGSKFTCPTGFTTSR